MSAPRARGTILPIGGGRGRREYTECSAPHTSIRTTMVTGVWSKKISAANVRVTRLTVIFFF